jgi:hypothetical protein
MVRCEGGGLLDVRGECVRGKRRKIVRVHPRDEVLQDVAVDALTKRSQGGKELVAVYVRVQHVSVEYTRRRSRCTGRIAPV